MMKKFLASFVLFGAMFCTHPAQAQFQDNSFTYWYSPEFREPDTNNGHAIMKNVIGFTHVDGGNKFGNNFLNIDMYHSNAGDPTASDVTDPTVPVSNRPAVGATEVYAVFRHDISLSRITGKKLAFGPVKDVLVTLGVDLSTKNTTFAPGKKLPLAGATFAIKVPKGFWDISLLWDKEWDHNGYGNFSTNPGLYNPGGAVVFHSAAMISTAWGIPFKVGKVPLSFEGFGSINSSKGPDGGGNGTKPETLLHPKLMYNFGKLISEKHNWQIGIGYEYWEHKYGEDSKINPGSVQNAPFAALTIHL
jgi:nucleoside-specific outer membrane channel protein Tsx